MPQKANHQLRSQSTFTSGSESQSVSESSYFHSIEPTLLHESSSSIKFWRKRWQGKTEKFQIQAELDRRVQQELQGEWWAMKEEELEPFWRIYFLSNAEAQQGVQQPFQQEVQLEPLSELPELHSSDWDRHCPRFWTTSAASSTEHINQWLLQQLCQSTFQIHRLRSAPELDNLQIDGQSFRDLVVDWWFKDTAAAAKPIRQCHLGAEPDIDTRWSSVASVVLKCGCCSIRYDTCMPPSFSHADFA